MAAIEAPRLRPMLRSRRLAFALAAAALFGAGCDTVGTDEPILVTTERLSFDFRAGQLVAGQPVTLVAPSLLSVDAAIPGGFFARDVREATVENVRIEQLVPSGAVYSLAQLHDVTFRLNGQDVAVNAAPTGTAAALAATGADAGGVLRSNALQGSLTFTPRTALPEEYGLRVSFVARVTVRGL